MVVPSHLVLNPPPHQGSVLGRIVAESRLGQLLRLWNALARSIAKVQAELAALRATEKLFSFTVGNDIAPYSKKSVLELCWETIERVQYLNRRIALYQGARERIERSGKFHYFLIRVAGIAGGPVAESKAMHPRYDRRVRDYEAEAACPNYLIESFRDVRPKDETPTCVKDRVYYSFGKLAVSRPDWRREHDAQIAEGIHRFFHPQPKWVDGLTAHSEGERQAKRTAPFTHSRVSKATRTLHEAKLFANVAAYQQKDKKLMEEACELKKAADLYWRFCVAFEFPNVYDQETMEKAAEHLIRVVPREHLELLFNQRKGKRHYVRHGAADLSFVRKQDLELATTNF